MSRNINQNVVAAGVYVASKEEMEILVVAQQKRYAIKMNNALGDNYTDLTSCNSVCHNNKHAKEIQELEQVVLDCHNSKHTQEIKELEQVASDCRRSKDEQKTLNNIMSRQINQNIDADGVYIASKEEMEILVVAQQKRLAIQQKYSVGDNDCDPTSNK